GSSMSTSLKARSLVEHRLLRGARAVLAVGLTCGGVQDAVAQGGTSDSATLFAELRPGNVVRLINPRTGIGHTIYESQSWSITNLTVSPTGQYLGVLEWETGVLDGVNYRVPPRPELILLDTAGHVVRRVRKDVVNYTWCGAQCLAYIRGTYAETDIGYAAQGVFVLHLSTGAVDS